MNEVFPQRLLNRKEAAAFLGVKEITLAIWQSSKRYPLPVVRRWDAWFGIVYQTS